MKTASFIRSLGVGVLCMLATYTSLWAQYPTTSYKLSTDGSTLEKWLGDETEINLTEAPLNTVQQIGEKAFSSNRDLQKIILGPSVKKIGRSAFDDCTMLSSIKIPSSLRVIEEDAFHGCKKLARIDLESVEEIRGSAFSLCRSLTTITIPQSLKKIGYAAFYGCSKVNKIEVEAQNSFFIAENNLLYNKDKSLLIMAPQGITFEELRIPETVVEISGRAFDGCKIKTIVLPARLERIGAASFFKCSQLQTITVEAAIPPTCIGNDSFAMINVEQCTLRVPAPSLEKYKSSAPWSDFGTIEPLTSPITTPSIKVTTTAKIGDYIMISAQGDGEIIYQGATPKFGGMVEVKDQTITITGNVKMFDCSEALITQIDLSQTTLLEKLWCSTNSLKDIDVSRQKNLSIFYCTDNELKSIDITSNINLEEFDCSGNQIEDLDLTKNNKLKRLLAFHNQIKSIDLTQNPELIGIDLSENVLTSLDVSTNKKLETIYCNGNNLQGNNMQLFAHSLPDRKDRAKACNLFVIDTKNPLEKNIFGVSLVAKAKEKNWRTLDYSAGDNDFNGIEYAGSPETETSIASFVTALPVGSKIYVGISSSKDFSIDWGDGTESQHQTGDYFAPGKRLFGEIKGKTIKIKGDKNAISKLNLVQQKVTAVNIGALSNLTHLVLSENELTQIDVLPLKMLTTLSVDKNKLQNIDLSPLVHLKEFRANENQLRKVDLSANSELVKVVLSNNLIETIDLKNLGKLEELQADDNQIVSIDLSGNPEITDIDLDNNRLSTLDLSNNLLVSWLYLEGNQIANIDISKQTKLRNLNLANNQLTQIDISTCPNLIELILNKNTIGSIVLNKNLSLSRVQLMECGLSEIDVTALSKLSILKIDNNNIGHLDLSKSGKLKKLSVEGNKLSSVDLSATPKLESINLSKNQLTALKVDKNPKLYSVIIAHNLLEKDPLDALFLELPDLSNITEDPTIDNHKRIDISNNPGTKDCNQSLATNKGWKISADTHNTIATQLQTVKIYPNPTTKFVVVEGILPGQEISIINTKGEVVFHSSSDGSSCCINTEQWEAGYYLIRCGKSSWRLVVQ